MQGSNRRVEDSNLLEETEKFFSTCEGGYKCYESNVYRSHGLMSCHGENGTHVDIKKDSISLPRAMSMLIADLLYSVDSLPKEEASAKSGSKEASAKSGSKKASAKSGSKEGSPDVEHRCKTLPVRTCVKVDSLRKMSRPYQDLEEWCAVPGNYLAARNGRVFIGSGEDKHIFHYPKSPLCNPFKVTKETPLEESLRLYEEHLRNNVPKEEILKLLEYSAIGCFCKIGSGCHVDIILKYLRELCESQL